MSEKKIRLLVRLISDSNYVLHKGEPGININTMIFKIGDGATKWSNLQAINVNLNDYYNKSQVDSKLTTELADYYTERETNAKIATEISKIDKKLDDNYYTQKQTQDYVTEQLKGIQISVDLSNYYNKQEITKLLADIMSDGELDLSGYCTTEALNQVKTDLENTIDNNAVFTNSNAVPQAIGGVAAGTTFNRIPIQDVLNMILYPYIDIEVSGVSANASAGSYTIPNFPVLQSVSLTVKKNSATNLSFTLWDTTKNIQVGYTLNESNIVDDKLRFSGLSYKIDTTRTFSIKYTYKGEGGVDSGEKTISVGTFTLTFVDPTVPKIDSNLLSANYYNGQTASVSEITADVQELNSAPSIKKLELYKNSTIVGSAVTAPTLPYKFSISDSVTSKTTYKVKAYYDKRTGSSTSTSEASIENTYSINFTHRNAQISLTGVNSGTYSKFNPQTISGFRALFTKYSDNITSIRLLEGSSSKETKAITGYANGVYSDTPSSTTFSYSKSNTCTTTNFKVEAYNGATKVKTSDSVTLTFKDPYCYGFVDANKTLNDINLSILKTLTSSLSKKTTITLSEPTTQKKVVYAIPNGTFTKVKDLNTNLDATGSFTQDSKLITFADGSSTTYQIFILKTAVQAPVNLEFS